MRQRHCDFREDKRKSSVTIAVPELVTDKGLLYAFLPSETRTGLSFHINANFHPSSIANTLDLMLATNQSGTTMQLSVLLPLLLPNLR